MITGLCDEFPKSLGKHREMFVLALLGGIYLCALPTCTYVIYIRRKDQPWSGLN